MFRLALALVAVLVLAIPGHADDPADGGGAAAFIDVVRVLQSPRCVNCHPNGDAPTVGDDQRVHPQHVKRGLERLGMGCDTCHRATATPASRAVAAPPAVPHWGLPPAEHPMVFAGQTPRQICAAMRDPVHNGGKDGAALLAHVSKDALVLYGWDPGGKRTLPPLTHPAFVERFSTWITAGMPCPP